MSSWLAWGGLGLIGASATAWVVAQPEVHTYPIPIGTARERLAAAALPTEVLVLQPGEVRLSRTAEGLAWSVGDASDPLVITANLAPNGASTDVRLSLSLPSNPPAGFRFLATDAAHDLARSALDEHVDAVLTGRTYDPTRIAITAGQRLQANPKAMQEMGDAVRDDLIALHAQAMKNANVAGETSAPVTPDRSLQPDPATYEPMIRPNP